MMKWYKAFVIFAVLLAALESVPAAQNGSIVDQKAYEFPSYDQAKGIEKLYSKEVYESAINDPGYEMLKLRYLSEGLKVVAYLYKPKKTNGKLPAIIFNRGGYIRSDIGYELAPLFHRLASEGFAVIAPLYRGSDGGEGRDEMGGADMADLMNILPLVQSLGFIDANNLFMYGESRGGMMTLQALRNGFPVNAAATFGAFTDLDALIKSDPKLYDPLIEQIWPDFAKRREEIIKTRSSMKWPEKVSVPIFIMHGGADRSVNPQHSLEFAMQLQKLNKKFELLIYADDNHVLKRNQEDRDRRVVKWFKKYLKH